MYDDAEILRFVACMKMVRAIQIASRFPMTERNARMRLAALIGDGYVESCSPLVGPWIYFATSRGIKACGLKLPPPLFSIATIRHDLAATDVAAALEVAGTACMGERELRAHERDQMDGLYVFEYRDPEKRRMALHFPDLVVKRPGGDEFIAIEIELERKSAAWRRAVLRAYRARVGHRGFVGVLYLAGPRGDGARLRELATDVGLGDACAVESLTGAAPIDALRSLAVAGLRRSKG